MTATPAARAPRGLRGRRGSRHQSARHRGVHAAQAPRSNADPSRIQGYFARITRLETERRELGEAIKDIYTEVKAAGLNPAALRRVVKRAMETGEQRAKREQVEEDAEIIRAAPGELAETPLGRAAMGIAAPEH